MEPESILEKLANKAVDNVRFSTGPALSTRRERASLSSPPPELSLLRSRRDLSHARRITQMSATFSKVSTRIWPIWDLDHEAGHIPIVWLMHDLSFPTVFSVRLNDTEVHRSQHEKAELPPVHEISFAAAGHEVKVSITCKPVTSWGFTSFEYGYRCQVDGLVVTENAATGNDPADTLAAQQLHTRVTVPSFHEVPAQRDPVTGLATTKELTVEYKVRLELEDGQVSEQWHRYSHFTNMHAALTSCLEEASPALANMPQPPPKSWGLNGYDAGRVFLEERRSGLEAYMRSVMASGSIKASRNPYILGLFGFLRPAGQWLETDGGAAAGGGGAAAAPAAPAPAPAPAPVPAVVDYSAFYSGAASDLVDRATASEPVPAPAPAPVVAAPVAASTPPPVDEQALVEEQARALSSGRAVAAPAVAAESLGDLGDVDVDETEGSWM